MILDGARIYCISKTPFFVYYNESKDTFFLDLDMSWHVGALRLWFGQF